MPITCFSILSVIVGTQELIFEINRRLFGDFRKVMAALTIPLNEYDAYELYWATIGVGTDEEAVTELLVPLNNSQISALKIVYKKGNQFYNNYFLGTYRT